MSRIESVSTPESAYAKACASQYLRPKEVAVCLRAALARRWPGVKFSVRSDSGLNVSWTDGPARDAVEAIASNYSFHGFDGSIDMRYSRSRWLSPDGEMSLAYTEGTGGSMGSRPEQIGSPHSGKCVEVKSSCDFVFCSRSLSLATQRAAAARLGYALPDDDIQAERILNTTILPNGDYLSCAVRKQSEALAL